MSAATSPKITRADGLLRAHAAAALQGAPQAAEAPPAEPADECDPSGRRGLSPLDVLKSWRRDGAVERLCTGWQTFDEASRGGFVLGRLGFLLGGPNAGKTALEAWLADRWLRQDVAVGALAVDEDMDDFLTRLAVMAGVSLDDAEKRSPATLTKIEKSLAALPLRLYGPEWTIEAAASDLHGWMKSRGIKRGAFFADSVQTVTCDAALDATSLRTFVGANVRALASAAARHRLAVIATGEIPRTLYDAGRGDDMKAGKESGAIEFAAKVQIVLRKVKRNDALRHVSVPKLKRGTKDSTEFFLRFDRSTHSLTEDDGSSVAPAGTTARILDVTRSAPKGDKLSTPSAVAKAAGGKYQATFALTKKLIADNVLKLHDGSYRSGMGASA